jgi:hypothetical protein
MRCKLADEKKQRMSYSIVDVMKLGWLEIVIFEDM